VVALADFRREGFCILHQVLSPEQVAAYRDHLLGVMGDRRHLGPDGRRRVQPWAAAAASCNHRPTLLSTRLNSRAQTVV
jgi:hypothetical protein